MYFVYVHTVPNGKMYIGATKDPVGRWNNGEGYDGNTEFYKDIGLYGWNNIKHEIVAQYKSEIDARVCEGILIALMGTESPSIGYNRTDLKDSAERKFVARTPVNGIAIGKPIPSKNILAESGLPISACRELIDQWIFNERNREIAKRRFLDGASFDDLAKEYEMSTRQAKNIVAECTETISNHLSS